MNVNRLFSNFLLLVVFGFLSAQSEVVTVRENLKAQFNKIEDFTVDVELSLDMTAIRMPRKKIKLYFKQPDLFKIETDGFALIPQYGLPLSPETLFGAVSDIIILPDRGLSGKQVRLQGELKVQDEDRDIWNFSRKGRRNLSMEILVDTTRWVVSNFEIFRGDEKIIFVETLFTELEMGIFLPEKTTISIQIPEELMDVQHEIPFEEEATSQIGNAILKFNNFKLNQGLEESLFQEEAE